MIEKYTHRKIIANYACTRSDNHEIKALHNTCEDIKRGAIMSKDPPSHERATDIYKEVRQREPKTRLVTVLPATEVEAIDAWGVPNGMESRTATIRHLIKFALEQKKAPGNDANQTPDASAEKENGHDAA